MIFRTCRFDRHRFLNFSSDFSPEGIRHMVESLVPSVRARQQLITYISQLQVNAYAQSSKNNSILNAHHQNESHQLRVCSIDLRPEPKIDAFFSLL